MQILPMDKFRGGDAPQPSRIDIFLIQQNNPNE